MAFVKNHNKFFWILALSAVFALLIYGYLRDQGNKFNECASNNITGCDSCAAVYSPYIIINNDGTVIVNF